MVSYNNSNVVQCLRQYGMFADSLNLVKTTDERNMIVKQLTKLEQKIIDLTNEIYTEEYYALANKECGLIEEERNRLNMLIELINQRLSYVEKRCNNHYQLTGESIDVKDVLGANTLENLEDRIVIIDKYSKNVQLEEELTKEVESLTNKITLAAEKIEINKSLNKELENSFCKLLSDSFEKMGFYELFENKDDIEYAYYETEKSLTLAELNLETAKMTSPTLLDECQQVLEEVKKDYVKYKEITFKWVNSGSEKNAKPFDYTKQMTLINNADDKYFWSGLRIDNKGFYFSDINTNFVSYGNFGDHEGIIYKDHFEKRFSEYEELEKEDSIITDVVLEFLTNNMYESDEIEIIEEDKDFFEMRDESGEFYVKLCGKLGTKPILFSEAFPWVEFRDKELIKNFSIIYQTVVVETNERYIFIPYDYDGEKIVNTLGIREMYSIEKYKTIVSNNTEIKVDYLQTNLLFVQLYWLLLRIFFSRREI